jgi:hypothetical protein
VDGAASGSRARRRAAAGVSAGAVVARVGWVPFACAIGTLVVVAGSALTWNVSPYWGRNGDQVPASAGGNVTTRAAARTVRLSPHRIEIPTLHAEAPIVKVGTTPGGELNIPLNPRTVGWWSPGAKPGARQGTAILAGHINYAGVTGALADIGRLRPGNRVLIFGLHRGRHTALVFRVTGVHTFHKTHLPYRRIFAQNVPGRVALVTCGGPFDAATGNYLDNIVAFAVPVHARRA